MGIAVSSWPLASAVARRGQLGVVSGCGLDLILARRLQLGDVGGHLRRAIESFPVREVAERVWNRYFVEGGKLPGAPFKSKPVHNLHAPTSLIELTVVANFVEVFLAKHGHSGPIGVNYLEKIQLPTLPSLFGAMLAGVDFVLMGAGIPRAIPGALDSLAALRPTDLPIDVTGARQDQRFVSRFDPRPYADGVAVPRPQFFAIVSSSALATTLARKCSGKVDGFVIEGPTAGGHNAPPRGQMNLDESGQPVYGPRDIPDLEKFRELGLPFWLAGSYGSPERIAEAIGEGAVGVQVGTPFAYCDESGIDAGIKSKVIRMSREGDLRVRTDALASPTGFPFKILQLEATLSDGEVLQARKRTCDLGYLRELYLTDKGKVAYRCASEDTADYVRKGGRESDTVGRLCVCNGLLSTVNLGQVRNGANEPCLVTAGDDVRNVARFLKPGKDSYSADDVLDVLLGEPQS